MKTSQSSIARIESGEHDVRMSTLERYALILGSTFLMSLASWLWQNEPGAIMFRAGVRVRFGLKR